MNETSRDDACPLPAIFTLLKKVISFTFSNFTKEARGLCKIGEILIRIFIPLLLTGIILYTCYINYLLCFSSKSNTLFIKPYVY